MDQLGNEQQICWEKVTRLNHFFRITSPYASGQFGQQLLAVHALFASLDELVSSSSDEFVALQTLAWWRAETTQNSIKKSRHPVIAFLHSTGAAQLISADSIRSLMDATEMRLEARAPASIERFNELCIQIYQPRIDVEAALTGGFSLSNVQRNAIAHNGGMTQLLQTSFSVQPADNNLWWVPLGLLARSGVKRSDLKADEHSAVTQKLMEEIISTSIRWSTAETAYRTPKADSQSSCLHLLLFSHLQQRLLGRLKNRKPSNYQAELLKIYLRDVFSVWRSARIMRVGTTD
jgi:phytoene/squalene synthetase